MNVSDAVATRRSIRAFTDQPVELETIRRVMDTARWAASTARAPSRTSAC
ncbi:MAG: nitroreductase family protein [Pseudomonadota bacterium]